MKVDAMHVALHTSRAKIESFWNYILIYCLSTFIPSVHTHTHTHAHTHTHTHTHTQLGGCQSHCVASDGDQSSTASKPQWEDCNWGTLNLMANMRTCVCTALLSCRFLFPSPLLFASRLHVCLVCLCRYWAVLCKKRVQITVYWGLYYGQDVVRWNITSVSACRESRSI